MRLVVSSAVLALWMTETPSNVVEAFSFQKQRTGLSITTMPSSSLFMSTIERPMTAPGSPNSAFGAYGKPPHNDDYSYGPPKSPPPPGSVDKNVSNYSRDAPADSFEAYMQQRNKANSPPANPPSPSDYFGRQQPPPPPSSNFGAPSTPSPTNQSSTHASNANFGAPSTPPAAPTTTTNNNNSNSFADFATRGNTSSSPQSPSTNNFGAPPATSSSNFGAPSNTNASSPPPPQPGSFEAYMNQRNNGAANSNPSSNFGTPSSIASTVAAAADPNSPLPPYMSPASLEDPNLRSANPSPPEGHPMPSIHGMASNHHQAQRSNAPQGTTLRESDSSMRPNIAQPISAPLAHVGAPDIGNPSEELVGRLDQVLHQQKEFSERLDKVDAKIDRTTQENIQRTQAMLDNFKEENKKTQETFMNRINQDIRGMRTTMDKVLEEQKELQQTQKDQTAKFANMERERAEQAEKLRQLQSMSSGDHRMERDQLKRMAALEEEQQKELEESLKQYRGSPRKMTSETPSYMNPGPPPPQQRNAPMDETERLLQQRLDQAQARKEELLEQLRQMQQQEEMHNARGPGANEDPHMAGPPPFASPLDQQMHQYQQQQQPREGKSPLDGIHGSPRSSRDDRDDYGRMRQPRFDDEDDDRMEEEQPKRRMMRDRLGKAGGEELYSRNPSANRRRFEEEDDDEDDMGNNDYMGNNHRRTQHERMMRRDPVDPPEAMGPPSRRPGSPAGRYDPRRGGPFSRQEDELAYDISDDRAVHKSLNNMKAFMGDEQMPNKSLFNEPSGGVGARSMDRRGSQQQGRRAPVGQGRNMERQPQPSRNERRTGLSEPPPSNPIVDQKIEHFLKETLTDGPKAHFDKEIENLLMVKYSPLFSWLKPANASFLRNVIVTYLQHKGCQVEMDLKSASPKAAREWGELLNILDFELTQRTGEKPRIMEEPNNQWGIYGSKNLRMKITGNNRQQEQQRRRGGGLSQEEAARRKRRNDKAFNVSQDPTDPTQRLL